ARRGGLRDRIGVHLRRLPAEPVSRDRQLVQTHHVGDRRARLAAPAPGGARRRPATPRTSISVAGGTASGFQGSRGGSGSASGVRSSSTRIISVPEAPSIVQWWIFV